MMKPGSTSGGQYYGNCGMGQVFELLVLGRSSDSRYPVGSNLLVDTDVDNADGAGIVATASETVTVRILELEGNEFRDA